MIEFLLAGVPLLLLMLAIVQLSLLWAGKSAVDTAAHLAARKFSRVAREDFRKAREMAFLEAFQVCRNRPGGSFGSAAMTALDAVGQADAERLAGVRAVGSLFALSPGKKMRLGSHYYLMLQSTRWVTVE